MVILQGRHNERDAVSNHLRLDCLFNPLFKRRSKKTSKLRITGLCEGKPPVTGGFHSQIVINAENVSTWWRHNNNNNVYFPKNYRLVHMLHARKSYVNIVYKCKRKSECSERARTIPWLLMTWLLTSPGHHQQWFWLCRINMSSARKVFYTWYPVNIKQE